MELIMEVLLEVLETPDDPTAQDCLDEALAARCASL